MGCARLLQKMRIAQERREEESWETENRVARVCFWIHRIGQFKEHWSWQEWIQGTILEHPPGASPGVENTRGESEGDQDIQAAIETMKALGIPLPEGYENGHGGVSP